MTTSPNRTAPPTRRELEASLEAYFRTAVRMRGGRVCKLIATERGIPDRMVLLPGGRVYLVELKAVGGRTSAIQQAWHLRAAELGTTVAVLEGRADVDAWLRRILDEADKGSDDYQRKLEAKRIRVNRSRARAKIAKGIPEQLSPVEVEALSMAAELTNQERAALAMHGGLPE